MHKGKETQHGFYTTSTERRPSEDDTPPPPPKGEQKSEIKRTRAGKERKKANAQSGQKQGKRMWYSLLRKGGDSE